MIATRNSPSPVLSPEPSARRSVAPFTMPLLVLLLAAAAALRIWGAFHDLPYVFHPDEPVNIEAIQAMVVDGDPNPHHFYYPSLMYDIDAAAAWLRFRLPALFGAEPISLIAPESITMGSTFAPTPAAIVLFRSLTIAAGVACVFVAFLVGRSERGLLLAVAAAAAIAICPPLVSNSRYVTPDIWVVLGLLLTLLASLRIARDGATRDYVLAGLAVGFTASAKYNGALACLCVAAAHLLRHGFDWRQAWKPAFAALASALAFAIIVPFALLDTHAFLADIRAERMHYSGRHDGMDGGPVLWYLASLWSTCGIALPLAACAIVLAVRRRTPLDVLASTFALAYFAFICGFNLRNERTLLPLSACVMLLAASLFCTIATALRVQRRASPRMTRLAVGVLGACLVFTPLRVTIQEGVAQTRVDSRTVAREWINAELPPHALIVVESYAPFADPARFQVTQSERAIDHPPDWYRQHGVDYLVLSEGAFGRYLSQPERYPSEVARYQSLLNAFDLVRDFRDGGYEVIVLSTKPK